MTTDALRALKQDAARLRNRTARRHHDEVDLIVAQARDGLRPVEDAHADIRRRLAKIRHDAITRTIDQLDAEDLKARRWFG